MPNFILLPRAAEELKIPFVASGGMADGRSLVAAMALGAEGMNMGTRFMATKDAPIHQNVKDALVAAERTRHAPRSCAPLRNTERVLNNAGVAKIRREGEAARRWHQVRGHPRTKSRASIRSIMKDGDMDAGAWSCGMVAGLIHDVPTVKELIDPHHERGGRDHLQAP